MSKQDYIEHYVVDGDCFYHIKKNSISNISDLSVWRGGGKIGDFENIEQARRGLFKYAKKSLEQKQDKLQAELDIANKSIKALGDDYFNVGVFKNPDFQGHECNFFNGKEG